MGDGRGRAGLQTAADGPAARDGEKKEKKKRERGEEGGKNIKE